MPGHDEEHKGGAGRHEHGGKGEEEHGRPGHKHEGGPPPGGRPGRRGGRRGHKGKRRPDDEDDTDDEDSEEEDDDDDCCDDEEEEKFPGVRRAGRVAGKAWKKEHGILGKIKDLNPQQKKDIRTAKREARMAFRKNARQEARK
ncbi:expressed unknown protein [Ectocarpus siliculosus]|uniref:Uncharacterized protein n=1 Tax=Ectocarpus siliculosus TaxID=2880 RepID=D8LI04_ECTSI|nr:expressed unknown protein [Ectocarpus siliculosus]|eukprot:CBN74435.1 expressed unknown protein [Ectocarpus siliculosus]